MRYEMKNEMKINENEIRIESGGRGKVVVEVFRGKKTQRAIKSRLTRERCDGQRWARAIQQSDNGHFGYDLETGMPCEWPKLD